LFTTTPATWLVLARTLDREAMAPWYRTFSSSLMVFRTTFITLGLKLLPMLFTACQSPQHQRHIHTELQLKLR
jgi:hypothetical protein